MKRISLVIIFSFFVALPQTASSMNNLLGRDMTPRPVPPASELVPVPENMQRLWILGSCEKGIVGYRFSKYFWMLSTPKGGHIERIGGFIDLGNGRYNMVTSSETTGYTLGSKGDLIQYPGDSLKSFSITELENHKIMMRHILFRNCEGSPILIKENPVRLALLPGLDKIHEACPVRNDIYKADCQRAVFSLFDSGKDGALDQNEMEEAWRLITPSSTFTACSVLAGGATQLSADGLVYFAWMFSHLDKNADKKISFEEIQGQWKKMQGDPLMSEATNILIGAQSTIDVLPEDVKVTCSNCCLAIKGAP